MDAARNIPLVNRFKFGALGLTGFFFGLIVSTSSVLAMAYLLPIQSENVDDGHIISLQDGVYLLTSEPYARTIVGVTDFDPALSLDVAVGQEGIPVAREGHVFVIANESNGPIAQGDLITSSSVPGVGMRATAEGYIVGQALENLTLGAGQDSGLVLAALDIGGKLEGVKGDEELLDVITDLVAEIFNLTAEYASDEPSVVFRYLVAALIIIIVILISYFGFARVARKGIEALGRNPLARSTILLGIVLNVIIAVAIVVGGFLLAYYIITLENLRVFG